MSVLMKSGSAGAGEGGLSISNSLRLRASASAYLSKTFGAPGNAKTGTISVWVKRSTLTSTRPTIFSGPAGTVALVYDNGTTTPADTLFPVASASNQYTTAVWRDPSAWHHVCWVVDSTKATLASGQALYINGVLQPMSGATPITLNAGVFAAGSWQIGAYVSTAGMYFDGYMAEFHYIDGYKTGSTLATYTDFGQFDSNGVWTPKTPTGLTYGTNGFHLDFKDAALTVASNVGLGKDVSGNGNYWTTNNISVTAGVTYDSMVDTPTNNYAVLNPLIASAANISWANLRSGTTAVQATIDAAAFTTSGAYWEVTAAGSAVTAGVISGTGTTNTTTVTANKVFGFRLTNTGALSYINITDAGSWTSITTGLTGQQFPYGVTQAADWNFGQRPWIGTPSGSAMSTSNRPSTSVTTSGTFTGNAAADGPFVWIGGVPTVLTINGNAVTFGTHADKTAGGFKLRTASASYNASGSNTWTATATMNFGTSSLAPAPAQGNP